MGECVSSFCERQNLTYNGEDDINNIEGNIENLEEKGNSRKNENNIPKNNIFDNTDDEENIPDNFVKKLEKNNIIENKENLDNVIKENDEIVKRNWERFVEKLVERLIRKRT